MRYFQKYQNHMFSGKNRNIGLFTHIYHLVQIWFKSSFINVIRDLQIQLPVWPSLALVDVGDQGSLGGSLGVSV